MASQFYVTKHSAIWAVIRELQVIGIEELERELECTDIEAWSYLQDFEGLRYLNKFKTGYGWGYQVTDIGARDYGDAACSPGYRPDVTISCEHEGMVTVPNSDGSWYWECPTCYATLDRIDLNP